MIRRAASFVMRSKRIAPAFARVPIQRMFWPSLKHMHFEIKTEEDLQIEQSWEDEDKDFDSPPLCKIHRKPAVVRTVQKSGANHGKQFYACAVPKCNFFVWKENHDEDTHKSHFSILFEASRNSNDPNDDFLVFRFYQKQEQFEKIGQIFFNALQKLAPNEFEKQKNANEEKNKFKWRTSWRIPLRMHDKAVALAEEVVKSMRSENPALNILFQDLPDFVRSIVFNPEYGKIVSSSNIAWSRIPDKLLNSLLPFQKQGLEFAVSRNGKVLIADEMGLGKTIQSIAIMQYYSLDWPLLVICPSSLKHNWKKELLKWIDTLKESDIQIIEAGKDEIQKAKVTITSYELLSRSIMLEKIQTAKFKCVIIDESHYLKTSTALRTKAVASAAKSAKRIVLLSGTASPSRPIELYNQLKLLGLKKVNKQEYGLRYCNLHHDGFGANYQGAKHLSELHLLLSRTVMIRRLKRDVLPQLPEKIRKEVHLPVVSSTILPEIGKRISLNDLFVEENNPLLIELYTKTAQLKLPYVIDFLRKNMLKEKFLCFGHHQVMLDGIEQELKAQEIKYIRIDGSTSADKRLALVDRFRSDPTVTVALLSIHASGQGLNFTPCNKVVFTELTWTPGSHLQAEDRVHRIGQTSSHIDIWYLLGSNTLDAFIWPLLSSKLGITSKTLDGVHNSWQSTKVAKE